MLIKDPKSVQEILYNISDYQGEILLNSSDHTGKTTKEIKSFLMQYNEMNHSFLLRPVEREKFDFNDHQKLIFCNSSKTLRFEAQISRQFNHLLIVDGPLDIQIENTREDSRLNCSDKEYFLKFGNLSQIDYLSSHNQRCIAQLKDINKHGLGIIIDLENMEGFVSQVQDRFQFYSIGSYDFESRIYARAKHSKRIDLPSKSFYIIGLEFESSVDNEMFKYIKNKK
jgi:hypothetical protein